MKRQTDQSIVAVWLDLVSVRLFVSLLSLDKDPELTPEAHLYFFDRYQRLADFYSKRGNDSRARRLQRKADEHYELGDGDGPPYAAAMGMPRPRQWISTDAVGKRHTKGPRDAA
jgi:hypothetical protein